MIETTLGKRLYKEIEHRIFNALAERLRYGAEKRLELNPHGDAAYTMHAIANEIVIANSLSNDD